MSKYKNYEELLSVYADPKSRMTKAMFLEEAAKLQGSTKEKPAKTPTVEEQLEILKKAFFDLAMSCVSIRGYKKKDETFVLYTGAFALGGYDNYEDSNISFADVTADVYYPSVIHDELRGSFHGGSRFRLYGGKLEEVIKEEVYSQDENEQIFIEFLTAVYHSCVERCLHNIDKLGNGRMIYSCESKAFYVWFDKTFIEAVKAFERKYTELMGMKKQGSKCGCCTHAQYPNTEDAVEGLREEKSQPRVVGVYLRRI